MARRDRRRLAHHRPRKPQQNGFIESTGGRLRDECLNDEITGSLGHARRVLALWQHDYNHRRPHTSLGGLTPAEAQRAAWLTDGQPPAALANPEPSGCQAAGLSK